MKTLNDYFPKIYCINLDKRPDKYELCLEEFKKINIDVERVSGIEGSTVFKEGIHKNAGAYGLLLTNIKLIEKAMAEKYESVLILEDDVIFVDKFNEIFNERMKSLPPNWDVLYLGGNNMFHKGKHTLVTGDVNLKVTKANYTKLNHELCRTTWTQTTHAVAINAKFYQTLMFGIARHSHRPIDNVYCILQQEGCNAYTFLPSLALQRPCFSDIENIYLDYNQNKNNSF